VVTAARRTEEIIAGVLVVIVLSHRLAQRLPQALQAPRAELLALKEDEGGKTIDEMAKKGEDEGKEEEDG